MTPLPLEHVALLAWRAASVLHRAPDAIDRTAASMLLEQIAGLHNSYPAVARFARAQMRGNA